MGSLDEMAMQEQSFTVLRQPLVQPLPFADQRFMRDLGAVFIQDDQARLSQRVEHPSQLCRFGILAHQFIQPCTPPRILRTLTQFGEAQEYIVSDLLLGLIQLISEDALGSLGNRTPHPA